MNSGVCASLVCLLLTMSVGVVIGQNGFDFPATQSAYRDALSKADAVFAGEAKDVLKQYGTALDHVRDEFRKQGNLDSLLVVDSEIKRFEQQGNVPAETPAGTLDVIVKAQEKSRSAVAEAGMRRDRKKVLLTDQYAARLDEIVRALTIGNEIQDAIRVRNERDKVLLEVLPLRQRIAAVPTAVKGTTEEPSPATIACPSCAGKGVVQAGNCSDCKGSGKCASCKGSGFRIQQLTGDKVRCISCGGSRKCRKCDGVGKIVGVCPGCRGSGKGHAPAK